MFFAELQAGAGTNVTICGSSFQLVADPLNTDEVGQWTRISGSGTFSNPASPISSITGLAQGDNILRWSVTNTVTSSIVGVNDIVVTNNRPTVSSVNPTNRTICDPFVTISGINPLFGTGEWSISAGNGTFVNVNSVFNRNASITGITGGINIFRWTITNGNCSSFSEATITFNKANAGPNQEICSDFTQLQGDFAYLGSGSWTPINSSPDFENDEFDNPTVNVSNLAPGPNIFRWTNIPGGVRQCRSDVTITSNIVTPSDAGSNQVICSNTTTLVGIQPTLGRGLWSVLTSTSGISFSNQTLPGSIVNNLPEGNSILEWKISKGICESASTVTITNNTPTKAIAGSDQIVCFSNTTLLGNIPTQGNGSWIRISGTGTIVSPNSNITSLTGISPGNNSFAWVISVPGCQPSSDTLVVVRQTPEIADVQTNYLQLCNSNLATIVGLNTTPGIGVWQLISGSGTITNVNNPSTTIAIASDGRIQLQWLVNIPGCTSTFDTLTIDRGSVSIADAGINQTICSDIIVLNAQVPSKGTGVWSLFNTIAGTLLSPNSPNATVTGLNPDANIFTWNVSSGFCSSMSTVTITNNQPTTAVTGLDQLLCTDVGVLSANQPSQGIGTWSLKTGAGSIAGINLATTVGTNLGLAKNVFTWTINKKGCISLDSIELFNNTPSTAFSNSSGVVCANEAVLTATVPAQGFGFWSQSSVTGVILNPNSAITSVAGLNLGPNIFIWTVSTTGCPSSVAVVTITNDKVTIPSISSDTCIVLPSAGSASLFFYGNVPNIGFGEKSIWTTVIAPDPVSISPSANSNNVTISGLTSGLSSGFYQFAYTISDVTNLCTAQKIVSATIVPQANQISSQCLPLASGVSQTSSSLISPNTASLRSGRGEIGRWSIITNAASPGLTLNSITGALTNLNKGVHVFGYTISNSNYPTCVSSTNATVAVITKADAGSDLCLPLVNSVTLVANTDNPINTAVGGIGTWTGGNLGASISTFGSSVSITGNAANLNYGVNTFYFTIYNSNFPTCISIDSVQVTRMTQPDVGIDTFMLSSLVNNQASFQLYANQVNTIVGESGLWSFANSNSPFGTFSNSSQFNSSISGLSPGVTKLAWSITNNLSAANCTFRDTLNVYVQSKANAGNDKKPLFLNPTPTIPLTTTLVGVNPVFTSNGEYGLWTLVSTNAPQMPTSILGPSISTLQLGNLRRGVSIFKWTMYNSNFPIGAKYTNSDSILVTVMTKANAGNDTCLKNVSNINLGTTSLTTPIRTLSNERFGWSSSNPIVGLNFISNTNSPIVQVTNLPIGRTTFYLSITNTGSGAIDTDEIIVTNYTDPNLGPDPSIFTNIYQLTPLQYPNSLVGETFSWTRLNGNSVFTTTGITPTVVLNDFNPNNFIYSIFNPVSILTSPSCFVSDTITIKNGAPSQASARNDTIVCEDFVRLYADVPLQGNGFWSIISSTGIILNPTSINTTVVGLSQGSNIFLWTVTTSGGTPSTDIVTITNNKVTIPNAGLDQCLTINSGTTTLVTLSGNNPNTGIGETGIWTTVSGIGIPSIFPLGNNQNVSINGIGTGFYRLKYSISDLTRQCNAHDTLLLTIVPLATVTSVNNCLTVNSGFASTSLISPNTFKSGEIGRWSIVSSPDVFIPVLNSITGIVSNLSRGVHEFKYTVSNTNASSCLNSNSANLKVSVITRSNGGLDTCIIGGSSAILIANKSNPLNASVGGVGFWSTSISGVNVINGGSSESPTAFITNLQFGMNVFNFTIYNTNLPSCTSSSIVRITRTTKPDAGRDTFLLAFPEANYRRSLHLKPNLPNSSISESAQWVILNSPFASFSPNATTPNTTVNGLSVGINRLIWRITNTSAPLTCVANDTVNVFVQTKASGSAAKSILFKNSAPSIPLSTVLSVINIPSSSSGEYGSWSLLSTNAPQLPILSSIGNNLQLSNLRRGVSYLKWTIMNSNFPTTTGLNYFNSDTIALTVLTKAVAGSNICLTDTVNLKLGNRGTTVSIRPSSNEKYFWSSSDPSVSLNTTSDSIPILDVSGLRLGRTKFYLTITNTGISNAFDRDSLVITKLTNPKLGTNLQAICSNTYTLTVASFPNSSVGEVASWKRLNGTSTITGDITQPDILGLNLGNNAFQYTIINTITGSSGTGCAPSDIVTITNNQPNLATISGVSETCFLTNSLIGNDPKLQFPTATSKWSLISTQPGVVFNDDTKPNVIVSQMTIRGSFYVFQYTINNLGCSFTSPVPFTMYTKPSIEYKVGQELNIEICSSDGQVILDEDSVGADIVGEWQVYNTGLSASNFIGGINNPKATITGIPQKPKGDQVLITWLLQSGECKSNPYFVKIYNYSYPSAAILGSDISLCDTSKVLLRNFQTVPGIIGTSIWTVTSGFGSFNAANTNTFNGSGLLENLPSNDIPSKIKLSIVNGVCPASVDSILVTNNSKPENVEILKSGIYEKDKICGFKFDVGAKSPSIGTGQWFWKYSTDISSGDGTFISNTNVTNVSLPGVGFYNLRWKVSNGSCTVSDERPYGVFLEPTSPEILNDRSIFCNDTILTLTAIKPEVGSYEWGTINGNNFISTSISTTTSVNLNILGELKYLFRITTSSTCSKFDTISLVRRQPPSKAIATNDTVSCFNKILLKGNGPLLSNDEVSFWVYPNTLTNISILGNNLFARQIPDGLSIFVYNHSVLGCPSDKDTVKVTSLGYPAAEALRSVLICQNEFNLNADAPRSDLGGTGLWSFRENMKKGVASFIDNTSPSTTIRNLSQGDNLLLWSVFYSTNNCVDTVNVTIRNHIVSPVPAIDKVYSFSPTINVAQKRPSFATGNWSLIKGSGDLSSIDTLATLTIKNKNEENILRWTLTSSCDTAYSDVSCYNDLMIPDGFSPNGDELNKSFEIKGLSIEDYPNAKLEVYNRWGKLVYKNDHYDGSWQGKSSNNEHLVDDSYFYIFKISEDEKPKTGFVQIKR